MVVAISGPKTTELVKVEARMEPQAFGIQSLCYLKVTGNGVKLWLWLTSDKWKTEKMKNFHQIS